MRFSIPMGDTAHEAEIWIHDDDEAPTYFIRRDEYFDRSQLYGLPHRDYDDNFARFCFFQKAVVALVDAVGGVQIVHANDWQTGLLPYYLARGIDGYGRSHRERVVFTIHNLAYQGIFPISDFALSNLPPSLFRLDTFEFYGKFSCMKAGLTGSHRVTTVSPTYAREIQTEAGGCGLDGVIKETAGRLTGILNGVDYEVWNPEIDPHLVRNYSARNFVAEKEACRADLLAAMGLKPAATLSVIGLVGRLADQKGLDILAEAMPRLMKKRIQMVLLGTGQAKYEQLCREWMKTWPGRFAARIGFDNALAHKIEAGADLFLMPSRFEPCGLNQMYSLRYGTPPIVHATGGLEDTVADVQESPAGGTGFKFREYTASALLQAVDRALEFKSDTAAWNALRGRAMTIDYSWDRSARDYITLYEGMLRHS